MKIEKVNNENLKLFNSVKELIQISRQQAVVYLNQATNHLYWSIDNCIIKELKHEVYSGYGKQTIATLSQQLTQLAAHIIKIKKNQPKMQFFYSKNGQF